MIPDIHNRPERKLYDKILYEQHLDRIKNILPTIDNKAPRKHPLSNRKQIEDTQRYKKIEKENSNILLRIAKTIQKSSIDNALSPHIESYRKFQHKLIQNRNKVYNNKITKENQLLLKRIIEVRPTIFN